MPSQNSTLIDSTATATATAKVLLVLREDTSARSVTSFPLTQTTILWKKPDQQQSTNQRVMNRDSIMGKLEQDKDDLNLIPDINLSLREMYLFNNSTDDDINNERNSNELTLNDNQHNVSDVKFGHHSAKEQPESYESDHDPYPAADTPPLSLTTNTSLISQKAIETLLHPPSTTDVTSTDVRNVTTDTGTELTSSTDRVGHQRGHNRKPSIYSAIGSLEDPMSSSFKGWENEKNKHLGTGGGGGGAHGKLRKSNYEFPSMATTSILLAPQTLGTSSKKKRLVLESSDAKQMRETGVIPLEQPRVDTLPPKLSDAEALKSEDGAGSNLNVKSIVKGNDVATRRTKSATKAEKKVTMDPSTDAKTSKARKSSQRKQSNHLKNPTEMFRPSSDAYTPRMGKKEIKYKPAAMRTPVQQMASPLGTLSRPNFRDALRRVAMIIHQHIVKIERRFEQQYHTPIHTQDLTTTMSSHSNQTTATTGGRGYGRRHHRYSKDDGLFSTVMRETFSEDRFITPRYKCTMVRVPMAFAGMVYGLKQIREIYEIPTENEIYEFAHQLFKSVQLSSECSIVGLIYVERLMETAKVPLLAETWRPIFMCGLLMASKVWQDLSSWNIEFASVYPRYSLESINRLELQFLRMIKWDLYISSSQYAKYYFALRSLVEKPDFRQRYNRMVGGVDMVQVSQARKIEARSTMMKEEAILHLSQSM